MRITTVDCFRRRTVTVHYSSNVPVGKETGNEVRKKRIGYVEGWFRN